MQRRTHGGNKSSSQLQYLQRQTTDPLYHSSKLRGPFILFSSSLLLPQFDINSVCLSLSSLFMIFLLTKHDAKRLAKRSRWHSSLDSYSCKGGLGCVPFTRHSDCYAQSLRQMACLHALGALPSGLVHILEHKFHDVKMNRDVKAFTQLLDPSLVGWVVY